MTARITDAIWGMFGRREYEIGLVDQGMDPQIEWERKSGRVSHIPCVGEQIEVHINCNPRYKEEFTGTMYLTVQKVIDRKNDCPKIIVDRSELRRTTPPAPNPLDRRAG